LGGSSSNRAYSSQYGRPRSRSLGSAANAGNATVYAHVIDLDELDRQIRGLAPASAPTTPGSRVPPRTNKRSMTWRSGAVAGIHTRPHKDELNDPRSSQRRQTLNDFTPGDYMMLLSHPGLVKDAYASVPPVPILPAVEEKATGKKNAKPIAKKVSAN
jgi:hypothetical protein